MWLSWKLDLVQLFVFRCLCIVCEVFGGIRWFCLVQMFSIGKVICDRFMVFLLIFIVFFIRLLFWQNCLMKLWNVLFVRFGELKIYFFMCRKFFSVVLLLRILSRLMYFCMFRWNGLSIRQLVFIRLVGMLFSVFISRFIFICWVQCESMLLVVWKLIGVIMVISLFSFCWCNVVQYSVNMLFWQMLSRLIVLLLCMCSVFIVLLIQCSRQFFSVWKCFE